MKSEIIFLLDRSGSMETGKSDYIGGFNQFLGEQKQVAGDCRVTFIQFDDSYEKVFDGALRDMPPLTNASFKPRGRTALYDALCRMIDDVGARLSATPAAERPDKVIVVILTDGAENASLRYTLDEASERIRHQRDAYQWEFVFLAANQDAFAVGRLLHIDAANTQGFVAESQSIGQTYSTASGLVRNFRR